MSAHNIARKFRRALRNGTGATFTNLQLQEMASYGVLRQIAIIEADELCAPVEAKNRVDKSSGQPSATKIERPARLSPDEGRAFIEALTRDR